MQEQISGKSPRFSQPLEECALSKGLLLSGHCFRRDPASFHHFPEGRNVVGHSTAMENSHLLHQETSARWQPQCHQFGAFTALATEDLEADGMLLDVHAFLTQCLHSANNGNKSPHVQSSEQGSTLFRERKPAIWEGCAICYHWNHTYLLPSWLHCCLEKNLCVEECNLCTLCVCVYVCMLKLYLQCGRGGKQNLGGWLSRPSGCEQKVLKNYIFIDCAEDWGPSHT